MVSVKSDEDYPNEWSDNQVMDVMFAPFRENRNVNPRSWDSKLCFWTDMIRRHCANAKVLAFNARHLPALFERNGKVPSCLNTVLDDLLKRGIVRPLSDHIAISSGWASWSYDILVRKPLQLSYRLLVKQPMSWAYSKLVGSDSNSYDSCRPKSRDQVVLELPDEYFILTERLKNVASAIYERHCSSVTCRLTDEVVGYDELFRQIKDLCADERSFNVAIMELCCQKLCVVGIGSHGEKVIRMVSNRTEKISSLSDIDMKIYRLKSTEVKLEEALQINLAEMEQCRMSAKMYLQQGKKSAALKCLRRKKLLDARQAQHEQSIDKINNLINILQQTESHKQVLDSYAMGVEAFKDLKNQYGLTEDSIDDTMLNIQEAFDDHEMINQLMAQQVTTDVDDDDLERELADIMAGKNPAKISTPSKPTFDQRLPDKSFTDLPDVPLHQPGSSPLAATSMRPLTGRRLLQADGQ